MAKKELAKKPVVVKASTQEDKKSALESAIKFIEKKYGAGAVMRLGQAQALNVDAIPTGSMRLDMALGIGGVPRGRIVEIYGPESSGKTTVALSIISQAQKMGGDAAFIDVEHALDPTYARALGVNIDNLLVSQPDSGEQALEIAEALIRSGAIDVIVLDSIAAMTTRAEIDGEIIKFSFLERRGYLVLYYLTTCACTDYLSAVFDNFSSAYFNSYRGIKFQCTSARSCFRISIHDSDFLTYLIYENSYTT